VHDTNSVDYGICSIEHIDFLKEFYNDILRGNDILTLLRKEKEESQKKIVSAQKPTTIVRKPSWIRRLLKAIKDFFT
jgi:hypothetical protein